MLPVHRQEKLYSDGALSWVFVVSSDQALVHLLSGREGHLPPVSCLPPGGAVLAACLRFPRPWARHGRENSGCPCSSILPPDPIIRSFSPSAISYSLLLPPGRTGEGMGSSWGRKLEPSPGPHGRLAAALGCCPKMGTYLGERRLPYYIPVPLDFLRGEIPK